MRKKFLLFIFIILISGLALISAAGLLRIPLFSDIFYKKWIADLGIETSEEAAKRFSEKLGVTPFGSLIMKPPHTVNIEVSDVELTSWVNFWCTGISPLGESKVAPLTETQPSDSWICPFKDFQIKFETGKFKSSAYFFKPINGIKIKGDITVLGTISKRTENSIDLEFEKMWFGNFPVFEPIKERIEREVEKKINKMIEESRGGPAGIQILKIDDIQILDGKAVFKGVLAVNWREREKNK